MQFAYGMVAVLTKLFPNETWDIRDRGGLPVIHHIYPDSDTGEKREERLSSIDKVLEAANLSLGVMLEHEYCRGMMKAINIHAEKEVIPVL